MKTVPMALRLFYEYDNYEAMCRIINSIPCDADTVCSMASAVYESYFGCCTDDDGEILETYLDDYLLERLRIAKIIS